MQVGLIGWRGMVGSVLVQRMLEERDFDLIDPIFFSTSQAGAAAPAIGKPVPPLKDARDLAALMSAEVLISCQGGDYTAEMHPRLREAGWTGHWIDAAGALRLKDHTVLVLDPVNRDVIDAALGRGVTDFIGGNCTVSLMLMAMAGLFKAGVVEWVSAMTYQAASGAGAKNMRELVSQMGVVHRAAAASLADPASAILDIDRTVTETLRGGSLRSSSSGIRWRGACFPGSTRTSATARARKSRRRWRRATRFWASSARRSRWMGSASA